MTSQPDSRSRNWRAPMIAACFAALTIGVTAPVAAQEDVSLEEALRKVNIAGRQRMLSQRMAKAACLMSQDITYDSAFDQMTSAYTLFALSHDALRDGNDALGLRAETFSPVISALSETDQRWMTYQTMIDGGIDAGGFSAQDVIAIDDTGMQLLRQMNIAVFQIARTYGDLRVEIPLLQTVTVDVAGRQRMLTQRAVKDACLMRVASDPSEYAARLAETVELFELSLTALQMGYEQVGVVSAPTPDVAAKLDDVRMLWLPLKAVLDRAALGQVLGDDDLRFLANESEPLLRAMDEAVGLYGLVTD